jgi:hypothetical protein
MNLASASALFRSVMSTMVLMISRTLPSSLRLSTLSKV